MGEQAFTEEISPIEGRGTGSAGPQLGRTVAGRSAPGLLAAIAVAVAVAVAVAACGLQRAGHIGCSNSRGYRPRAGVRACPSSAIRTRLDIHAAGVAAGTAYFPLDFTNISPATCRLSGFPAVTIAMSRGGRQVGTAAVTDRSISPRELVLPAGRTAHIWLRLVDVMNLPRAECKPVLAAGLRVRLPGRQVSTFIGHALTTCAKHVHGTDLLTVEPFQPGQAHPGTAQ
jgi:Protein of unknown function (DUF4232)